MIPFETIPDDLVPLTAHFKQMLTMATKEQPLVLFLDSVDQLTGTQDANKVSWLPTRLPPYCKVRDNSMSMKFVILILFRLSLLHPLLHKLI